MIAGGASGARDIAPLSERMGYMQALRVAIACSVLAAALLASDVLGATIADLALVCAGYLALAGMTEGLRRLDRGPGLAIVAGMLLVDGIFIAWAMYETGGIQSPLRFLAYLHIVAVTLLASYRTGVKVAIWHSLLFIVAFYAQASGLVEVKEAATSVLPGTGSRFNHIATFNIAALWLVALGTSTFSALNERELKRRKADLEILTRMAGDLQETSDPRRVAEALLRRVSDAFSFKRGAVLAGHEGDPALLFYLGPGRTPLLPEGRDAVVDEAFATRAPVLRVRLDPDRDRRLATVMPFAHNVVVVPLVADRVPIGVMALEHVAGRDRIERHVVTMLGQFAAHAALALRNSWLVGQVQKMADTDPLTGAANRRVFEEVLGRELSRAARNGEQVTLLLLDVDHFKAFNDSYGHQAGDEVLKGVAASLLGNSRDFDTVARYGGEEFVVILPACTSRESLAAAERLRTSLAEIDAPAPVTASAGVATFPVHATDARSLVQAADEALYESKRQGRDRVTRSRRRRAATKTSPRPSKTPPR